MECALRNPVRSRLCGVLLLLSWLCLSAGPSFADEEWHGHGGGGGWHGGGYHGGGGWQGGGNDFTGSLYRGLGFGLGRSFGNWVFGSPPVVVQAPPPPVVV